ncbi:MAG: tyrosine-type recombinase/integrase [Natronomonas sp.]
MSTETDHVSYFLQDMTFHGRSERTRDAYERVLRSFEAFLEEDGSSLSAASERECMAWVHTLRDGHAPSTVASYASYVHRFYTYMVQANQLDENPMALVTTEMEESIDADPARREIGVPTMRSFVGEITHPLDRAVVVTLLKTGIRVGELCNLDVRDLSLNDAEVRGVYGRTRGAIDGRPDTLYVPSEPTRNEEYNGVVREASNKRKRDTVIPVDEELQTALKRYLAVRPDTQTPGEPLFCSTAEWGRRMTPAMVRSIVRDHASDRGWYRKGGDAEENVTPHYFRHFFTTHLRDATGDRGVVKYIRGDVADDVIDTYTHDWGNRVRETYEQNIYSVLGSSRSG